MKTNEDRVDRSLFTRSEREILPDLLEIATHDSRPPFLKGGDGRQIQLPKPLFKFLVKMLQELLDGSAIVLVRENETFTTQAAANYLGMSRQHFVTLLQSGKMPFHTVGSHRRVTFKALRAFAQQRDNERRGNLKELFNKLSQEGHYDADYTGDNAG